MGLETSKVDGQLYWVERDEQGRAIGKREPTETELKSAKEYEGPGFLKKRGEEVDLAEKSKAEEKAKTFRDGLTTNKPTEGFPAAAGRNFLPVVGGTVGSVAGSGPASIPLAGAGSAAGEALRQAIVEKVNPEETNLKEAAKRVGIEGVMGAAGEGAGKVIAKGAKAAYEGVAPQVATLLTKVPEKFTEMAVKGELKGAKSVAQAGADYADLISKGNMRGLDESLDVVFDGKLNITTNDWIKYAEYAKGLMQKGQLSPQEAPWARQAIQKYQTAPKLQKEAFAGVAQHLDDFQSQLDDYLETVIPGFADVRANYLKAKGAEAFDSWFPQNKDKSPDTLRFLMGTLTQAKGLPLMSPKVTKGVIDAANASQPALAEAAKRAPVAVGDRFIEGLMNPPAMEPAAP